MKHRPIAAEIVNVWERRAKGELYLDALLHHTAKGWLIDAIEKALDESAGGGKGRSAIPVKPAVAAMREASKVKQGASK